MNPSTDEGTKAASVAVQGGSAVLIEALRQLDAAGVVVKDVGVRRPTLDDVFLSLTGHAAEESDAGPSDADAKPSRRGERRSSHERSYRKRSPMAWWWPSAT